MRLPSSWNLVDEIVVLHIHIESFATCVDQMAGGCITVVLTWYTSLSRLIARCFKYALPVIEVCWDFGCCGFICGHNCSPDWFFSFQNIKVNPIQPLSHQIFDTTPIQDSDLVYESWLFELHPPTDFAQRPFAIYRHSVILSTSFGSRHGSVNSSRNNKSRLKWECDHLQAFLRVFRNSQHLSTLRHPSEPLGLPSFLW